MSDLSKKRPFGIIDKIGYSFGDMGCNFSFQLVSSYMLLFYTQCIGLSTKTWAWIIVVSKVWDAINDVLIGNMVDTKRIGKKSKFMPWILIGGVGLIALTVLIFVPAVKDMPYAVKTLWCLLAYCLWSVAYTMVNVPYGSLHSVITDVPTERTSLSTFRSIGAALPTVLIMLLPKIVYDKESQLIDGEMKEVQVLSANKMFIVSIVFSVVAFGAFYLLTKMVTERVVREESAGEKQKTHFLTAFKSYFSNRALMGITVGTIGVVVFYNSSMSVNNLIFQFYFGDATKASLAMIASYLPLVLFMPFASKIVSKIGKKKLIVATSAISVIAGILMLVLPITPDTKGMIMYVVGLMVINVGCCVFQVTVWAIVADCIDMSYAKTGIREEGSLYALYSFSRKLSQGIGSAIVALGLSAVGFIENASVQTAETSKGILNLYIIFLTLAVLILALSMQFIYNIGLKEEKEIGKISTPVDDPQNGTYFESEE